MLGLTARKATLGCAIGRAPGWHSLRPPKCCNPKRKETGEDALPRRVFARALDFLRQSFFCLSYCTSFVSSRFSVYLSLSWNFLHCVLVHVQGNPAPTVRARRSLPPRYCNI